MLDSLRAWLHHNRKDSLVFLLLLVIGAILFAPMMHHWRLMGDYTVHNNLAYSLTENAGEFFRNTPHFLYHVLVAGSYLLIPSGDIYVAGVRVMVLSYLVLMALMYWQIRAMSQLPPTRFILGLSALATLGLIILAPINLLTPNNLYFGYFAPNVYHNPTVNLMKPFAVGLFFAGLLLYGTKEKLAWWWIFPYALLTGLCLVSKPSFILAYVPAMGLVTAFFMVRHLPVVWASRSEDANLLATFVRYVRTLPVNWAVLLGGITIPAFLILVYQAMTWTSSGGITIAPFRVFLEWTLHYEENANKQILFKLIMSVAFPIVTYLLHFKSAFRNFMLNTAWVIFAMSIVYAYLFVDLTVIAAGDFVWGAQSGVFLLHLVSVIFLFSHYRYVFTTDKFSESAKIILMICIAVFILHVVSGIWWYYLHLVGNDLLDLLYGVW